MKIAIAGAHRVGKTTLAEKLLESLPGYDYKPEPYLELEETGYRFSETPTLDDFIVQLEYSIEQVSESGSNVLFDRCPIDILAYMHAVDDSANIQTYFHNVESIMSEIDLLVFVPIEKPDRISCPESELPQLRYKVNEILSEWISDFDIRTIEVHGDLPSRCEQVMKMIL